MCQTQKFGGWKASFIQIVIHKESFLLIES